MDLGAQSVNFEPPDQLSGVIYMRPSVLSRPYSERQMIVVTDDDVAEALHRAENERSQRKEGLSRSDIALLVLSPTSFVAEKLVNEAIKAWKRALEYDIHILHVGESESAELKFPLGHPRDAVVYVGHPALPDVYYTIADFHRVTFEHKFSEAINLLMHLGATHIRVEHVRGWSQEFSSRLSAALGQASTNTTAGEVKQARHSRSQLLYEATFSGTTKPRLPSSLVWYHHEPTWQSIAKGRVEFGLQEFSLNVTYEDDYGVNAGLKASVHKAGFDLGGKFEDHEATTWRIAGQFRTVK